jgi:hypothetical protein
MQSGARRTEKARDKENQGKPGRKGGKYIRRCEPKCQSTRVCSHTSQVLAIVELVTVLVLQPSSNSQRQSRVVQHKNNTPNKHNKLPWMRTMPI